MSPPLKIEFKTVQILRAIAAASVVYFHTFATPHFGRFGVDVFFVISGFVMAMIVAKGQKAIDFAVQRLIRIVPLYWLVTTAFLIAAKIRPDLAPSTDPGVLDYIRSLFFIPYFKQDGTLSPIITMGWTLNYEMYFYLCVFAAIAISRKHSGWIVFGLLLTTYVLLGKSINDPVAREFFGNEILVEFVLGMLIFTLYQRGMMRGSAPLLLLGAVAAYCLMVTGEMRYAAVNRALMFGLPSAMLVYCGIGLESTVAAMPSRITHILVGVGNASYATYMTHYFVIQSVKKIVIQRFSANFSPLWVLATFIAVLVAGHMIDRLVDKPLNRMLRRVMNGRASVAGASTGASYRPAP